MHVRVISDLHLDVCSIQGAQKRCSLCIVCGDVMNGRPTQVIDRLCDLLPDEHILLVPGNHEGYGVSDWGECMRQLQQACITSKRVTLLYRKSVQIGSWKFIGAPLWTSFVIPSFPDQQLNMQRAQHLHPDYKNLRFKGRIATPQDILQLHHEDLRFLQEELNKTNTPTVVVTHHAPSLKSIVPRFEHHPLNPCFLNQLDHHTFSKVQWWFHGHTHHNFDYIHYNTRVLSNARGYSERSDRSDENPAFNLDFFIDLSLNTHPITRT